MIISFLPCDKCGDLVLIGKLINTKGHLMLCEKCYQKMQVLGENSEELSIKDLVDLPVADTTAEN